MPQPHPHLVPGEVEEDVVGGDADGHLVDLEHGGVAEAVDALVGSRLAEGDVQIAQALLGVEGGGLPARDAVRQGRLVPG